MKRLFIVLLCVLSLFSIGGNATSAESISYPFDAITIVSAYKFEIDIDSEPNADSFLYSYVASGETAIVYVGNLTFTNDGVDAGSSTILIVTNAEGDDIIRWVINSYALQPDESKVYEFSSHITIDPEVGIIKTFDNPISAATIIEYSSTSFALVDNTTNEYPMVPGSLEVEPELDIVIAAYAGDE